MVAQYGEKASHRIRTVDVARETVREFVGPVAEHLIEMLIGAEHGGQLVDAPPTRTRSLREGHSKHVAHTTLLCTALGELLLTRQATAQHRHHGWHQLRGRTRLQCELLGEHPARQHAAVAVRIVAVERIEGGRIGRNDRGASGRNLFAGRCQRRGVGDHTRVGGERVLGHCVVGSKAARRGRRLTAVGRRAASLLAWSAHDGLLSLLRWRAGRPLRRGGLWRFGARGASFGTAFLCRWKVALVRTTDANTPPARILSVAAMMRLLAL
mmetsp:Transcript_40729/g.102537  ORF Transcript_40729/g.102537 Transcript_40729/m.102537 type:complete len:268 (-) Transcript_40729:144-947(-)